MKISSAAKGILDQLVGVVSQLEISEYQQPISNLGNSTLGQHVRHTLEFFICLQEGITEGVINYDQRKRDPDLEENPDAALLAIKSIQDFISFNSNDLPLKLVVDYGLKGGEEQVMDTHFERELAYTIEHAVHHMAILKIGIAYLGRDISIPEEFGIAVSTLRHRFQKLQNTP